MRLLLALPLVLAACAGALSDPGPTPDASGLVLTTDQAAYAPGAMATVTFRNATDGPVSLSQPLACATVERRSGGGWSAVPSDRMCTAALVPVAAGASVTAEVAVPGEAGTYRVSQAVYPTDGEGTEVVSAPFEVR